MNNAIQFPPNVEIPEIKSDAKEELRQNITKNVADESSILGTVSDVSQLNAAILLALLEALKSGDTFAKFRTNFMAAIETLIPIETNDPDIYEQASAFLSNVQSGDVILTAVLKGLSTVIDEMATRSTGVAQVLMAANLESSD